MRGTLGEGGSLGEAGARVAGFRSQRVKKEHAILPAARPFLEELARAPGVVRVIPGRIKRGQGGRGFYVTVQYPTESGFKLLLHTANVQEAFVVTRDPEATLAWLEGHMPRPGTSAGGRPDTPPSHG